MTEMNLSEREQAKLRDALAEHDVAVGTVLPGKSFSPEVLYGGPVEPSIEVQGYGDGNPMPGANPEAADPLDLLLRMQEAEMKEGLAQTPGSGTRSVQLANAEALQLAIDALRAAASPKKKFGR
jgi:hypothetical protein